MKDLLTDASTNFPRTQDQRVYHLGLRVGEVANRILTVGSPSRAQTIASYLDAKPKPILLSSERGFLTITGRYKGVPISIVSIGMGNPNMDFFVREVRECLSGDMVVVRLGSCGALIDVPVGSIVIPRASVAVSRNYDYNFFAGDSLEPYRISKPASADLELHLAVKKALEAVRPVNSKSLILHDYVNASADSFYSSQGRHTSFPDHNEDLIERLKSTTDNLATLEMETFHLLHLAASWQSRPSALRASPPPLTTGPVSPVISTHASDGTQYAVPADVSIAATSFATVDGPRIRAAAAQLVFAARASRDFITPMQVSELEAWSGRGVLEALKGFDIPVDRLHPESGSVWELN